jgi:hypothetical protein
MLQMSALLLALESGQPLRGLVSFPTQGGGSGILAQPQLHPVLQQYLDLLPSKGLQAATLRFTQVQVRGVGMCRPLMVCLLLLHATVECVGTWSG